MGAETRMSSFPSEAVATTEVEEAPAAARLPALQDPPAIHLPVVYVAELPLDVASACDGAQTLRLVEQAVRTMQELRGRADRISAQAVDLIHLTHRERARMQADLQHAREAAALWESRARRNADALGAASLEIRRAEFARRALELSVHQAGARAEAAEARVRSLEHYLKEIRTFLEARMEVLRR